jgi:hypothetical protein
MTPPSSRNRQRVYLSGGMEYAANEGREWRSVLQEWLEKNLAAVVFNPNHESQKFFDRNYPGLDFRTLKQTDPLQFKSVVAQLVDLDCREIARRSDYLICYWDEGAMRGAGTKGELTIARYFGKPVYMVTTVPLPGIPGWVLGCTDRVFPSFEALQRFLLSPHHI